MRKLLHIEQVKLLNYNPFRITLGIYFLARITTGIFEMGEWMRFILLTLGVITIITAVMMALVQHNYKRLLGFHAVSKGG